MITFKPLKSSARVNGEEAVKESYGLGETDIRRKWSTWNAGKKNRGWGGKTVFKARRGRGRRVKTNLGNRVSSRYSQNIPALFRRWRDCRARVKRR